MSYAEHAAERFWYPRRTHTASALLGLNDYAIKFTRTPSFTARQIGAYTEACDPIRA